MKYYVGSFFLKVTLLAMNNSPFITEKLPEITVKVLAISCLLTVLLAVTNAYLALKIGILTSASIPAAVLAMGFLRCFKQSNVLETNLIQTAASAGEAIAGGITYCAPALIIIGYWTHFPYWQTMLIALTSGLLGIFFSIPLRRALVSDPNLPFPEAYAITEVLKASTQKVTGLRHLLWGGGVGALLELATSGFKLFASQINYWFVQGSVVFGFGAGFSASMMGAGYLIGSRIGSGLLIGAILSRGIGIPVLTGLSHQPVISPEATITHLWHDQLMYLGLGAMFCAGSLTLMTTVVPACYRILSTLKQTQPTSHKKNNDIPGVYVGLMIVFLLASLSMLFYQYSPVTAFGFSLSKQISFIGVTMGYILVIGFILVALCSYFSGLVGVTATPGSAIVIACLLLMVLVLNLFLHHETVTTRLLLNAAAMVIFTGTVITGAGAVANDNMQDLKVGYLLGSTPWKQQVMLSLGVIISACVVPPVMQLLWDVYGIAGIVPHPGIHPANTLPAPPAAMMAAVTQAIFKHDIPVIYLANGAGIIVILGIIARFARLELSLLSIAIGMYLPLASSIPLALGGCLRYWVQKTINHDPAVHVRHRTGMLLACGLVAGAALMSVGLAIPFAISRRTDLLCIMPEHSAYLAAWLSVAGIIGLSVWIARRVISDPN